MAFLVISGVTVKVAEFGRLADERGGGGNRRTINGELRGRSDWVKRQYAATLVALDDAERDAVLAVIDPDNAVVVSGDLLPTVTANVEISGDIPTVRTGDDWYFTIPVTIRES